MITAVKNIQYIPAMDAATAYKEFINLLRTSCSVLTCHIIVYSWLCKWIQADQFNARAILTAGGSDDDDCVV